MNPPLRRLFDTPITRDARFSYAVKPDGVYAIARRVGRDGMPVAVTRKTIKIADIRPPLDPRTRLVLDPDGYVASFESALPSQAGARPAPEDAAIPRRLVVLVTDPGTLLSDRPRSPAELLALPDGALVDYLLVWLFHRQQTHGRDTLSAPERAVMLGGLAFHSVNWDGPAGLLAHHRHDLEAMRDALEQVGLSDHAEVLAQAGTLPPDADPGAIAALGQAWSAISAATGPLVAAYVRAHAADIQWTEMT